ncbi:MAG: DUF4229 domain-containing protein [Agromyces sp.]
MTRIPAWLTYTLLRLAFVFVPFGILLAIGMQWLAAILLSTMLAFALSLGLLRTPREATALSIYEARQRKKSPTQAAEEALEDAHAEHIASGSDDSAPKRAGA